MEMQSYVIVRTVAIAILCLSLACAFLQEHVRRSKIFTFSRANFAVHRPEGCRAQRYFDINSMAMKENDFIPYRCFNQNDRHLTVLGMHLKDFNKSTLRLMINGKNLTKVDIHSGHHTFAMNAPISRDMVIHKRPQIFQYKIGNCSFRMQCPNYYDKRKDELNLCVYTRRKLDVLQPFLNFYQDFVDRIFIYNNERGNANSFRPLRSKGRKFKVIPWYLDDLRDLNISSKVYDELVAHNYRNYSRDAQKVQTNDCMYKNRNTKMVLMVDDDEYLNFLNRKFYRHIYEEVKDDYDDIVMYRNFCNTTIVAETRLSAVLARSTAQCPMKNRPRLEKAIVLPKNCPLYEIHRCTSTNSYSLRHLNIYLAHSSYPPKKRKK